MDDLTEALRALCVQLEDRRTPAGMKSSHEDQSKARQAKERSAVHRIFRIVHGRSAAESELRAILVDHYAISDQGE